MVLMGYSRDSDFGLYFDEERLQWFSPVPAEQYSGVKKAILAHPDDLPAHGHYSNSSMARLSLYELEPGGAVASRKVEGYREHVLIVLSGEVEIEADDQSFAAKQEDVVFIQSGESRGMSNTGAGKARVLSAMWTAYGDPPAKRMPSFLTSERIRPLIDLGGEGYLSVETDARQSGERLRVVSYGAGHIRFRNSLLLYHLDLPAPRNFTANTILARMGLSAYYPGGGTRWHFHPDREQAFVIIGGRGLMEMGYNTIQVKAGDILFAPRHVGHGYKTVGEEPLKFFELEWGR